MSVQKQMVFETNDLSQNLYGPENCYVKLIANLHHVQINVRGNQVTIVGKEDQVDATMTILGVLVEQLKKGRTLNMMDVQKTVDNFRQGGLENLQNLSAESVIISGQKSIRPKSQAQLEYMKSLEKNDIVFGVGPAGTGKTYLAMALALSFFLQKRVKRIIVTRPAVEAGEKLGFLPGNLEEKVDPYLRPVYDALYDFLEAEKVQKLFERNDIEIAPLAFMRGRTLSDAFIILDEAQNTTSSQMKMFLTRVGPNTKAMISGDVTQVDLPPGQISGLVQAQAILKGIEGISFCYFDDRDVVRHRLVREVIKAYESFNSRSHS